MPKKKRIEDSKDSAKTNGDVWKYETALPFFSTLLTNMAERKKKNVII